MSLQTLLISGPPFGGKSAMARLIAAHTVDCPAHYVRLECAHDGYTNMLAPLAVASDSSLGGGWCSTHRVLYTPERVFETLPDALREVRSMGETAGFVIIEADSEPSIRHAYSYDYRVFVMPMPEDVYDVFRSPGEAAEALQQVMQDTAAFASEIFGLFQGDGLDDSAGVVYHEPRLAARDGVQVEQLDVREAQLRQFLDSPIGVEIASRIQLQPGYPALVESDFVVINTATGPSHALRETIQRLEKLLGSVRHDARRRSTLCWGEVLDSRDPAHHHLLRGLRTLLNPD